MGHDHVAKGAGVLIEADAAADIQRLRHVDLDVIDEVAVPDRLEKAVAEAEGQNVLRRLLAEEMVDAEDLVFVEHLVQFDVERHRALEVGPERLLHDHPRPLGETRLVKHPDRGQRRAWRHAEIVDELEAFAERFLGPMDGLGQSLGALLDRDVIERRVERRPVARSGRVIVMHLGRLAGERPEVVRRDVVERNADDPALRNEARSHEVEKPRQQLALRQVPRRTEQNHDLRQLRADPGRYLRHRASPIAKPRLDQMVSTRHYCDRKGTPARRSGAQSQPALLAFEQGKL